jgi:hypothetical protein
MNDSLRFATARCAGKTVDVLRHIAVSGGLSRQAAGEVVAARRL